MSTSVTDGLNLERGRRLYLASSALCLVFSMVYEAFSHGVYSPYMVFAVAFPFLGGLVAVELLRLVPAVCHPGRLSINLYNSGIATLTLGSLMRGVLDIYGTGNDLVRYYAIVGILFVVVGLVVWSVGCMRQLVRLSRPGQ